MSKYTQTNFRVTEQELEMIRESAQKLGLSVSRYFVHLEFMKRNQGPGQRKKMAKDIRKVLESYEWGPTPSGEKL